MIYGNTRFASLKVVSKDREPIFDNPMNTGARGSVVRYIQDLMSFLGPEFQINYCEEHEKNAKITTGYRRVCALCCLLATMRNQCLRAAFFAIS